MLRKVSGNLSIGQDNLDHLIRAKSCSFRTSK